MPKILKNIFLIFFMILGVFFVKNILHAETLIGQLYTGTQGYRDGDSSVYIDLKTGLDFDFAGISINGRCETAGGRTCPSRVVLTLWECNTDIYDPTTNVATEMNDHCTAKNSFNSASSTISETLSNINITMSPVILNATKYYVVGLDFNPGYVNWYLYGATTAEAIFSVITGTEINWCDYFPDYTCGGFDYIYFDVNTEYNPNLDINKVTRTYPKDGDRIESQPTSFTGVYYNSDYDQLRLQIHRIYSTGSTTELVTQYKAAEITPENGIDYSFSQSLIDGNYLYLVDLYNSVTGSSTSGVVGVDIWTHFVVGNHTIYLETPFVDNTGTTRNYVQGNNSQLNCNFPITNWITEPVVKGICLLFTPSYGSLLALASSTDQMRTKIPFGYVTYLGTDLQNLASTTPATNTPQYIATSSYLMIKSISDFSLFVYFKQILSYLIYFLLIVYILMRSRKVFKLT